MFQLTAQIDADILDAYADFARNAPRTVATFLGGTVRNDMMQKVQQRVTRYPGKVSLPIQWTSPKQKGYVFKFVLKRDAQGNIIPYQRTGGLGKAWVVDVERNGLALHVYNSASSATFVIGARQQQFHKNTGWPPAKTELDKIMEETIDMLIEAWVNLVDTRGRFA